MVTGYAAKLPPKFGPVSVEEVRLSLRLEADVYNIATKKARLCVTGQAHRPLLGSNGLIKQAFYPTRFKRIYTGPQNGVPFFLPSQMTDLDPKPDKYISRGSPCNFEELALRRNTLLLTRSGTIGTVSLVSKTLEGKIFSDDVIRITFHEPEDLGFVYAYLKSRTGNLILSTNGYGSVITHLEPEHLAEIPVPDPPRESKAEIHDRIMRSVALRDESNDLLAQALELLKLELRLPPAVDFSPPGDEPRIFSLCVGDLDLRADVSYHERTSVAIERHLAAYADEMTVAGDTRVSRRIILPGRFKRIYVEEGRGKIFIGGKQLYELDPGGKKYLSLTHHAERISGQLLLHENMVLITCSGTIGKVTLVPRHWEGWAANQHIIRVVAANEALAGYLYVFLASDYANPLITRFTYGSVVDEIDDRHVARIPVPLLRDQAVQSRIGELALQANALRYKAYLLEQEAMTRMDAVLGEQKKR